jgi:hypothetical protein
MAIPPIRSHGQSGHLQDHNDISTTLSTHDSYLDQPVTSSSSPTFQALLYAHAQSQSSTINISTNLITTVDSFPVASYRSAEYNVQLVQGTKYTTVKAIVVQNGTDAGICEYGKIELGGGIVYILSADIIDSHAALRIVVPDGDINPLTVKIYKVMINI